MTAWPERRRGGFAAAVAARAEAWLLEPAAPRARHAERSLPPRPVVAVVGLGRGCGATTLARALGVELARRDPGGAAAVVGTRPAAGPGAVLATAPARRLARGLTALGCDEARAVGRLALVGPDDAALTGVAGERPAPVVLDVSHGAAPERPLALADRAVLVASPDVEPALAAVAAKALARDGIAPLVVVNRRLDGAGAPAGLVVGEGRLGARLALAGRDAVGALGSVAAALADACAEAVAHA